MKILGSQCLFLEWLLCSLMMTIISRRSLHKYNKRKRKKRKLKISMPNIFRVKTMLRIIQASHMKTIFKIRLIKKRTRHLIKINKASKKINNRNQKKIIITYLSTWISCQAQLILTTNHLMLYKKNLQEKKKINTNILLNSELLTIKTQSNLIFLFLNFPFPTLS